MAVSLSLLAGAGWQFFDDNGAPLTGGLLYTYTAGTTTPLTTYTSSSGAVANANPIVLDAAGRVSEEIWLTAGSNYKFVLKTSAGVTVWTKDNILGSGDSAGQYFLQSGAGATSRTVQAKLRDTVSVKDFGALGDGSTNDQAAIANAIAAVSATGGVVYFPGATYRINSSLTLPSNVCLSGYGATLSWGGGASPVITTATTGVTSHACIEGLTINGSTTATKLLELYSTYHCTFRDLTLTSTSTTNVVIDMLVNTSGGTNPDGNRNNVFGMFDSILQEGTCGTAVRMTGNSTVPTVVTLNTFVNLNCRGGAAVRGIDFAQWCDSNYFSGVTRINLPSTATGAVGVEWNTATPTANAGVYANNFDHLAVDTFGVGSGRVGIKMNLTKFNKLGFYFQEPAAEGGAIVISAFCYGYDITHAMAGTNYTARKVLGENYGIGGNWSAAYSIWTNSFTLTGANQVGVISADTFSSSASSAAGFTADNKTEATTWTLNSYYGVNVADVTKGAGSTVTNNIGVYIVDRTAGTNNYGIQLRVSSGANKYNIYADGTAPNYFAGAIQLPGGTAPILQTMSAVTSGAGALTGTLTNSPVAGNPTKWIPFNDNGTTRYIPAW